MILLGTIVNTCTILTGSILGGILRKGLREEYRKVLYQAMGFAAAGLGINAIVQNMPESQYPVLFIASLAVGGLCGTMLDIDGRFQRLTERFSNGKLGEGLATAILLFCIGTLSILGPIQSSLYGNNQYLFTNAMLDLVTSMVLASAYGIGIALAAPVLFLWQGSIYLAASLLQDFLTEELMTEIAIVGGFLIAASGISILEIKNCKTLNMLPALLVPVLWFILKAAAAVLFG